jgi:hypothetical protein
VPCRHPVKKKRRGRYDHGERVCDRSRINLAIGKTDRGPLPRPGWSTAKSLMLMSIVGKTLAISTASWKLIKGLGSIRVSFPANTESPAQGGLRNDFVRSPSVHRGRGSDARNFNTTGRHRPLQSELMPFAETQISTSRPRDWEPPVSVVVVDITRTKRRSRVKMGEIRIVATLRFPLRRRGFWRSTRAFRADDIRRGTATGSRVRKSVNLGHSPAPMVCPIPTCGVH